MSSPYPFGAVYPRCASTHAACVASPTKAASECADDVLCSSVSGEGIVRLSQPELPSGEMALSIWSKQPCDVALIVALFATSAARAVSGAPDEQGGVGGGGAGSVGSAGRASRERASRDSLAASLLLELNGPKPLDLRGVLARLAAAHTLEGLREVTLELDSQLALLDAKHEAWTQQQHGQNGRLWTTSARHRGLLRTQILLSGCSPHP